MNKFAQKFAVGISALVIAASYFAVPALAATVHFTPWTYDPGNVCDESATLNGNHSVTPSKPCTTATNASAGVTLDGVDGLSTTGMTLSFDYSGYCGAGAPRFNVSLSDGSTIFLGCAYGGGATGTNVTGTATFTAGQTYGGVLFPTGATVTGIDIVQDEQGTVTISNIKVNGTVATATGQTLKDACKKGGWQTLTDSNGQSFKNQGQCVSYFNHQ
jgi:hypothetical protein